MNVGYSNSTTAEHRNKDICCPICGSDIYVSKYGNDFRCMNKECAANIHAWTLIRKLEKFITDYQSMCRESRENNEVTDISVGKFE